MTGRIETCSVCGAHGLSEVGLSRVVIEGRSMLLCRPHATMVATAMPETFDDMRALFVGQVPAPDLTEERRSPIARRADDDRRVFPPRFEGRRMSNGRRASDPRD